MRALLALDGSPSSLAAASLAASLAWPTGSLIDVVGVAARANAAGPARHELEPMLDAAAASLSRESLVVRRTTVVGRPGTVVVERAAELRAELVIVGSRGHGPLRSMLLGSVSAEVVDHAPCPVLVVRRPVADSLLVAVDGSPSADGAVRYLIANRILAGRPVEVLSVAPGPDLPDVAPLPEGADRPLEPAEGRLVEDRWRAEAVAANAARSLDESGYTVRWSIGTGDAAHEIIEAAANFGSGLIVVGSRGHTGLTRLLLGSVARNVLLHTDASVLVVREPLRVEAPEEAKMPARVERSEAVSV
ncbi:MAG TPA: universal stress protein [Candidatus Baltobacteraceae bacterium]|nr:universal stress protein [Candidatus Baltobacteraceae bacterium]